ncbi:cyclase family protein [Jiangella asiatica]|uniref:Cyclase family protein n=1 Tax=Jiangella asiatica TaxID=2530372 RepID=A0A4R5DDC6_9ACTN|nr:cyclase family protein [Jiangella asiatica]TDE11822.1 cyclase family protein [Jiangella asiatica]
MLVDVTQPLYGGMPKALTLPDVSITPLRRLADGEPVEVTQLTIPSHAGTHIDAPSHVLPGAKTIDQIPLERFTGPGVVVSVRRAPGETIGVQDVLDGGPELRDGDMLLLDTGWAAKFGTDDYHDHPSLHPDLAEWLVERGVGLVGVDVVTPDLPLPRRPEGFGFPVHHTLLGREILIAENLASLAPAAGRRVHVSAFPLIVRGGDAGHVRMVLDVPA